MKYTWIFLLFTLSIKAQLREGTWHAALKLNDTLELPFTFTSEKNSITIHNGEEKIVVDEISFKNDSVFIQMPIFDSEIRCQINGSEISGHFFNHARKTNNVIPFYAVHGLAFRFSAKPEPTSFNITGKYHVVFDGEDAEGKDAVGIFSQDGNHLSGTFLTTTGDYRYLDGEVSGDRMWLSCFDGSHLFLFTATIKGDSLIQGEYLSGQHWHDTWSAMKDENAKLPSEESFTAMKPGYEKFEFTFKDENGKLVSLSDKKYKGKPVIVQLMGSWCPNCMDETKFLSAWYNSERKDNVEIIALDFEKIADSVIAQKNIERLKKRFDVKYTILFAGSSDKKEAAKTLPMLSRVFAWPTMIFLDRDKKVIKIHTGFSGPATGDEYLKFQEYFKSMINKMEQK